MTEIFNSPALGLRVFQKEDGSLTWTGTYKGTVIKDALPVAGGEGCILLLDPDASNQPVFKNLLRIGCNGDPKWFADLPGIPNSFVDMQPDQGNLSARTWSGYKIRIDLNSGRHLGQEFVK